MSDWISVEERLPETEERVAILYRYKGRGHYKKFVGEYNPFEEWWYNLLDDVEITHWMPLPEPPDTDKMKSELTQGIIQ